ncbi:MAG: transglycosylase SLT domain-containing protein [Bacteroidales bacterium]
MCNTLINTGLILSLLFMSFTAPDGDDGEKEAKTARRNHLSANNQEKFLGIMVYHTGVMYDSLLLSDIQEKPKGRKYNAKEASENDSLIRSRLEKLSYKTEIPLIYHPEVKKYIKAYALENPEKISNILGRSAYYYPLFEQYLDEYGLPPELKHLSAVESSLDPLAVSSSNAVGLWQFLAGSASLFDLEIGAWIDERCDPYKSTEAACEYLSYLFRIFDDWHLALAAYNGGPGAVQKAIARCDGNTNYWEIRHQLSGQMQNYVPAFIAMNYVLHYHKDFDIKPAIPLCFYHQTDTVKVRQKTYLDRIAEVTELDPLIIKKLNPVFRQGIIPESDTGHPLILPRKESVAFILHQDNISGIKPDMMIDQAIENEKRKPITYNVKKGDSLHKLAIQHRCTIEDIRRWNDFQENEPLYHDDKIILYVR